MKKQLFSALLAVVVFFCNTGGVLADGMVIIKPDPYGTDFDYADETDQQAFINYQNGLQKMIVSIKTDEAKNYGAVWLFPVPAEPSKVVIDVIEELPQMTGQEITSKAEANLNRSKDLLLGTQIYPALASLFQGNDRHYYGNSMDIAVSSMPSGGKGYEEAAEQDVVTYERLDKDGVTSEIITAKTADGLYDYFASKGLKIEKGMISALDNYIGKNYSFVASWISGSEAVKVIAAQRRAADIPAQEIKDNLEIYLRQSYSVRIIKELQKEFPRIGAKFNDESSPTALMNPGEVAFSLISEPEGEALKELITKIQSNSDFDNFRVNGANLVDDWQIDNRPSMYPSYSGYPVPLPTPKIGKKNAAKGISVYFPTNKIYFPLLPTSVYDSKIVPATIKVVGYTDPVLFEGIKNFSKVSYYTEGYFYGGTNDGNNTFFDNTKEKNYTKIEINAPSKYLTDDLWINQGMPVKSAVAAFIASYSLATFVILLILCSIAAALLAGLLFFKGAGIARVAALGMSNCLSLVGFIVATIFVPLGKPARKEEGALLEKIKQKGYFKKRKIAQIFYFAAAITLFLLVFGAVPILSAISYSFDSPSVGVAFAIGLLYLPLVFGFLGWRKTQVAAGDEQLFADLKAKGYSAWSFKQTERAKVWFVVAFSLIFLALSLLITGLLKMWI